MSFRPTFASNVIMLHVYILEIETHWKMHNNLEECSIQNGESFLSPESLSPFYNNFYMNLSYHKNL